ncbi:primosomal protein N' [Thalassotalea agariperforans]
MPNAIFVEVAIPVPLRQLFTYAVPEKMVNSPITLGERVIVPFGPRKVVGIVMATPKHDQLSKDVDLSKIKPIIARVADKYHFDSQLLNLLKLAANYYHHPIGDVFKQALPVALRDIEQPDITPEIEYITAQTIADEAKEKLTKKAAKQASLLSLIEQHQGLSWPELRTLGFSKAQLKALESKSYISARPRETQPFKATETTINESNKLVLSPEQASIVAGINQSNDEYVCHLIDGITGSGKTEVYLQAIEKILLASKQVLILVPEIGLTPQTLSRFEQRFNVPIHLHHSGLNDSERLSTWLAAQQGSAAIIIGTRSAIFTPLKNLGLIIVDEEHDASFKQQDSFRYHGRDIAVMRASQLNIPILLGSATPCFETLQNAKSGKYRYHQLLKRPGTSKQATIELIDLAQQQVENGLSGQLIHQIKTTLARGEQVLVFINRRGFAPAIACKECHWVAECTRCNHPYTLHKKQQLLICHHCAHQMRVVKQCQQCGSVRMAGIGQGTEQLEEHLQSLFPDYQAIRIDRDSTRKKGELAKILQEVADNKHQLLVGTQMLAKGHHFPNVTLVAVLDADGALFSYDFRASENLAQLLIQVAGRAGRASKPGKVLLQTQYPDHPLLQDLIHNGYPHFAAQALIERQQALLPPFCHQVLIRAEANYPSYPEQFLRSLTEQYNDTCMVAGPMPAPMEKKAGKFRFHLLIQSKNRRDLHRYIHQLLHHIPDNPLAKKVRWSLDIDPQELTW